MYHPRLLLSPSTLTLGSCLPSVSRTVFVSRELPSTCAAAQLPDWIWLLAQLLAVVLARPAVTNACGTMYAN